MNTVVPGMGTSIQVIVVGGPVEACTAYSLGRLSEIEDCLSRFRPDSELSQLNRLAGFPTIVSPLLTQFLAVASEAMMLTNGLFDPTLGAVQRRQGYDRTFEDVVVEAQIRPRNRASAFDAWPVSDQPFSVDRQANTVHCAPDVQLDLGGIAKGLTADLLSQEIIDRGAEGCCVNVGGDVRVRGLGPLSTKRWDLTVDLLLGTLHNCKADDGEEDDGEDDNREHGSREHGSREDRNCPDQNDNEDNSANSTTSARQVVTLQSGAVCSSSILKRFWPIDDGSTHHILDPHARTQSQSDLCSVSIIARTAAAAEVLATVALVEGSASAASRIAAANATGLLARNDGRILHLPGIDVFQPAASQGDTASTALSASIFAGTRGLEPAGAGSEAAPSRRSAQGTDL